MDALFTKTVSILRLSELIIAITNCMSFTFLIMKSSPFLIKLFGQTGLNLLSRIMGIILTAVGIQFVINGIREVVSV